MSYKITGRVLFIGEIQTFPSKSGTTYTRRDLVIMVRRFDPYTGEPEDDKDNTPKFTFFGERARDLESLKEGDLVTVFFEISGRAYDKDGKTDYFTSVEPRRVVVLQSDDSRVMRTEGAGPIERAQPIITEKSGLFGTVEDPAPYEATKDKGKGETKKDDLPF